MSEVRTLIPKTDHRRISEVLNTLSCASILKEVSNGKKKVFQLVEENIVNEAEKNELDKKIVDIQKEISFWNKLVEQLKDLNSSNCDMYAIIHKLQLILFCSMQLSEWLLNCKLNNPEMFERLKEYYMEIRGSYNNQKQIQYQF